LGELAACFLLNEKPPVNISRSKFAPDRFEQRATAALDSDEHAARK
jgi:hypothetical protein